MTKLKEDDFFVEYKIETNIYGDIFINESGKRDAKLETIYAYCTLNKKTEEFSLDQSKSNPYFLVKNSREIRHAHAQLVKRVWENMPFEDSIHFATAG